MTYDDYAEICKAIGDPTRACIFDMLKAGEMCACKILAAFNITQPTLSYHMRMLTDCKLVSTKKDGKWNHYSLNWDTISELTGFLNRKREQSADINC
ncbi:MAG: transcriptional regulator [Clostridia bacterium]|nr:transcriptional regulator [Clostridia bacterium]